MMLEMEWTVRYYRYQSARWAALGERNPAPGHVCYAARTEAMWLSFADRAEICFEKALNDIQVPVTSTLPSSVDDLIYA